MIFEIDLELFRINTIIILEEIISLLNIRVLEIRINEKFEPQQGGSRNNKSGASNNKK